MASFDPQTARSRVLLIVAGLAVNALLSLVKLFAGVMGHSQALIADAVESLADVVASLVTWGALRVSARPADETHPYGHGRAEPAAALIIALMLFGAAGWIIIESIHQILTPHVAPAAYTLAVLVIVVVVKEAMYRRMDRAAQRGGGEVLNADAWHHRSDAITSAAAGVGILVALVGGRGYEAADDWAALIAAGVVVYNAARIGWRALDELMDRHPAALVESISGVAGAVAGVCGIEKVLARRSGVHYWVDMHVEVDPQLSVRDAHAIAHAVKDAVRQALPQVADVLVHIEPHGPSPR